MGFEIKNICTVVPNPHHENYNLNNGAGDGFYYFSVFITPKLQFDGTLKEFYEMLNWPAYVEKIFYPTKKPNENNIEISDTIKDILSYVNLTTTNSAPFSLEKDYSYLAKMDGIEETNYETSDLIRFLKKGREVWKKLFHENVPVEAWPIFLKPQSQSPIDNLIKSKASLIFSIQQTIDSLRHKITESLSNSPSPLSGTISDDDFQTRSTQNPAYVSPEISQKFAENIKLKKEEEKKLESLKKLKRNEKYNTSKYRQEFHKKISALSRYPHVLRSLGLIQDFKILKKTDYNGKEMKDIGKSFVLKLNIDINKLKSESNDKIDFKEFAKSVQVISPYTKCELVDGDKKLRAYYIQPKDDPNGKADYKQYVNDGFLNTHLLDEKDNPVFEVNQDYFEDRTQDFGKINQSGGSTNNNHESTKVVGINGKVFKDEEIEILKQKVSNKPRISKGFSIKIHSQPGSLLTGMDEKLKELTDDNIESEESAFMAHHLDCGYRVDVNVITPDNENEFHSLCTRQAEYVVDRKKDRIHIPVLNIDIPLHEEKLFTQLVDEPWLEEVRLINSDGSEDRFEEIARWNGWSLTCPPLNNNNSAENNEGDDLELRNIKPINLPKLRFGDIYQYQFRIRTVDICGNGPQLNTHNNFPQECIFKGPSYDRKEGIGAPLFFPTYEIIPDLNDDKIENSKKKIDERYKGEDNETLVIRTKVKTDGSPVPINEECVRYITPPYVTMHFAEASGMLNDLYAKAKNDSGALSELYKKLAAEPKHYYERKDIEGNPIPFLFDNEISEIQILWNDQKNSKNIPFTMHDVKDPISLLPLKMQLQKSTDTADRIIINQVKNLVEFSCYPGSYENCTIRSLSYSDKEPSALKPFRLIHAVQRPFINHIIVNNNTIDLKDCLHFKKIIPLPATFKDEQKYQVEIECVNEKRIFPFSTTGEIVVHTEYNEFELNSANPNGWSYIAKDYPKKVKGKSQPGIGDKDGDVKKADKFYIRKSWSNLDDETESDKLDTLLKDDEYINKLTSDNFDLFKHSYPDTKFRKVKYRLEAVSKFSEFFDIEKHNIDKNDSNPFSVFASLDKEFDGNEYHTIIANSAKPSKPNITSIVPVFTITDVKENKTTTHTFEHKTFRIYLGSVWYETGLDEQIAVIHEEMADTLKYNQDDGNPIDSSRILNTRSDSSYIKNKISIFANDPTDLDMPDSALVKNIGKEYILSSTKDSLNNNADSLQVNTYLFESTLEKQFDKEGIKSDNIIKEHVFSVFEVKWDMEQNEFYADIELNINALSGYTYFFKFAVCRYQENSILLKDRYDYRFSDVVMTDMVYILPQRTITKSLNKYKIKGKKGGKYIFKNGNHDSPVFNYNKIYLISETKKGIDDDISKTTENKTLATLHDFDKDITIDTKEYETHFIEEYEDIPLDDHFYIDDNLNKKNPTYNPREDPRKRLVFFYKIK